MAVLSGIASTSLSDNPSKANGTVLMFLRRVSGETKVGGFSCRFILKEFSGGHTVVELLIIQQNLVFGAHGPHGV
jgi:hypothetical protein